MTQKKIQIIIFMSGVLIMINSLHTFGQNRCLSDKEKITAIKLFKNSRNAAFNKSLQKELLQMQKAQQKLVEKIIENYEDNQQFINERNSVGEKNLLRLCQIIKENGWLTTDLVGDKGILSAMYVISHNRAADLQKEIFPVILEAVKKGQIDKSFIASMIDNFRVSSGSPQYFGTQFEIRNEIIYLYPLENEKKVDKWRNLYNLLPLSLSIKELEMINGMPVIKTRSSFLSQDNANQMQDSAEDNSEISSLPNLEDDDDLIRVATNLINVNVRLSQLDSASTEDLVLQKSDFKIFEDNVEQEISFFSTAETPFDLILLLDLSGSTIDKQGEIRKSTKKFIEAARPQDRIAIITFTHEVKNVAELTADKKSLLNSVDKIGMRGGSKVWDALEYVYKNIVDAQSQGRRSSIVFMTDGVDLSLAPHNRFADTDAVSAISFADLLETVRKHETTVFPIYFDTESSGGKFLERAYRNARRTLNFIAEESGGQMYQVKRAKDLEGTYDEIIQDLSKIYSLGYQSDNVKSDGSWHSLRVEVLGHPNLTVYTRKGFYSN